MFSLSNKIQKRYTEDVGNLGKDAIFGFIGFVIWFFVCIGVFLTLVNTGKVKDGPILLGLFGLIGVVAPLVGMILFISLRDRKRYKKFEKDVTQLYDACDKYYDQLDNKR